MRVANVIEGLASVSQLHVLLIDVSPTGERIAPSATYTVGSIRSRRMGRLGRVLHSVRVLPSDVHYRRTRGLRRAVAETTSGVAWDLVWCSRARTHLLTTDIPAGARIVDFDDLNDRLLTSEVLDRTEVRGRLRSFAPNLIDRLDARKWRRLQRRISTQAHAVVVCSRDDLEHLGAPNGAIIPNGYPDPGHDVAWNLISRLDDARTVHSRPSMVFAGALTYEPNRLAVEWFVERVLPAIVDRVPGAVLEIIGHPHRHASSLQTDHVVLTGHVPDVSPYYAAASIAIAPVHSGGGTRLKVIEALARGVPLVATNFACSGFDLVDRTEVRIADNERDFARACVSLLGDPGQRRALAVAGRQRFELEFDAARCEASVAELTIDVLERSSSPPRLQGMRRL